jgi:hypothetical protein
MPLRWRTQGKTQLVLNFLNRNRELYNLSLWVSADNLQESCLSALSALGAKASDPARVVTELGAFLRAFGGTKLVVLDNADTVKWSELSPLTQDAHVVVTTRNRELLENATRGGALELSTFTEAEALELLGAGVGASPAAVDLVRLLGFLPLAVEHVRASMLRQRCTAAAMLATLRGVEASGGSAARSELERAYSPAVLAAFDLSVANASAACAAGGVGGGVARRAALMCAYLHAERVPRWFVEAWLERACDIRGESAALVVEQLVQFSLLTVREGDNHDDGDGASGEQYDMHRILQAALRAQDGALAVLSGLLDSMAIQFRYDARNREHLRTAQLSAHAESCAAHGRAVLERLHHETQLDVSYVLATLGRWLDFNGLYAKARERAGGLQRRGGHSRVRACAGC